MQLDCRAYHKTKRIIVYNLIRHSERTMLARIEGSEKWIPCDETDLVIQHGTGSYDITFRPIFEDDMLRDKTGGLYRVILDSTLRAFKLYDLVNRTSLPFEDMGRFEVIGHKYHRLEELTIRQREPFPKAIKIAEDPIYTTLSFRSKDKKINDGDKIEVNLVKHQDKKEKMLSHKTIEKPTPSMDIPLFMNKKKRKRLRFYH